MENSDRIAEHVDDARRMGINVLPPDVNHSDVEFSVVGDDLTFGLGAIKGLGEAAVEALVDERQKNGPYASIFDLAERVDSKLLGKSALELLIKAGALDSLKATRPQHMLLAERAVQSASAIHRDRQMGQKSLFGGGDEPQKKQAHGACRFRTSPTGRIRRSWRSRRRSSASISRRTRWPKMPSRSAATRRTRVKDLAGVDEKAEILLGGMVSSIKKASTKKPSRNGHSRYVNFDFETPEGVVRCIMWPEDYAKYGEVSESRARRLRPRARRSPRPRAERDRQPALHAGRRRPTSSPRKWRSSSSAASTPKTTCSASARSWGVIPVRSTSSS